MKKRTFKNLSLRKKMISNLQVTNLIGGISSSHADYSNCSPCYSLTAGCGVTLRETGCHIA